MSESIQVRSRGGKGGHKYNKVNQQKKFHLLSLIYRGKMLALGTPDALKQRIATADNPDPSMEQAFIQLVEEADQ